MIHALAGQGISERRACRLLGVNRSGYDHWKRRPPTGAELRRQWLTPLIHRIHKRSFETYGHLRVTADLRLSHGIVVNKKLVYRIMKENGLSGVPGGQPKKRQPHGEFIAADLVKREFGRSEPDRLWITDITEHPTREGKLYCCAVLDAFSRKAVGWSIDSSQTTALVTNALGMAIGHRRPEGTVVHSDRGSQFTSWAFTQRITEAGLRPSVGRTGTALDNAMMESFWARMQVELLNRKTWRTRVELANAMFEYIELFHNKRRRHSSLNMLTPVEFEELHQTTTN